MYTRILPKGQLENTIFMMQMSKPSSPECVLTLIKETYEPL